MPAHIGFYGRIGQVRVYSLLKVGKLGIGRGKGVDRGHSLGHVRADIQAGVRERREFVVLTYEKYREIVEKWNPGRPAWKASEAPVEYGRRARIGTRMGGQARQGLAAFKGGHEIFTNENFEKIDVQPVSPEEWTNCLARDCPLDEQIKRLFKARPDIQLMFIRDGDAWSGEHNKKTKELMKLKRIEMGIKTGDETHWEIVWSNCDK